MQTKRVWVRFDEFDNFIAFREHFSIFHFHMQFLCSFNSNCGVFIVFEKYTAVVPSNKMGIVYHANLVSNLVESSQSFVFLNELFQWGFG